MSAFRKPFGFSIYHALTLRADKRFSNGLSFLASYTKGKLIDDVSTTVNFLGQASSQQNAYDRRAERAVSTQDVAQRLVISYVYELPIGRGKPFLNNFGSAANWVASGWQVNGITTFQSGIPLVITSGQNNAGIFSPGQRPNIVAERSARIKGGTRAEQTAKWFDTSLFDFARAFTFGNAPRTQPDARNPGTPLFDISIFKNNYFHEGKHNAQFRAEFFNAFNTTQLGGPGTTLSVGN